MPFLERSYINPKIENGMFCITGGGVVYPDPRYSFSKCLSRYLFEYIEEGKGHVSVGGEECVLHKGDFCFLKKGITLRYFSDPADPYRKLWFGADGMLMEKFSEAFFTGAGTAVVQADVAGRFREIIGMLESGSYDGTAACRIVLDILTAVASGQGGDSVPQKLPAQLKRYMDDRLCRKVTLLDLSNTFHLSKRQLTRVFEKEYGCSPGAYFTEKKLDLACRYLLETDLSIGRIAQTLNYCDESYFSSEFKRRYGKYPTVFRREQYKKETRG
jgi:AraC-like DNA-binding protein